MSDFVQPPRGHGASSLGDGDAAQAPRSPKYIHDPGNELGPYLRELDAKYVDKIVALKAALRELADAAEEIESDAVEGSWTRVRAAIAKAREVAR